MNTLASWISIAGHPFVMVGLLVGIAARQQSATMAESVGIVTAFTVIPLLIVMIRQVRRGAWRSVDASNAGERPVLYAAGVAGLAALLVFLRFSQPHSFLMRGATFALGMFAVCALLTIWVKVSLHMAFASFAGAALAAGGSAAGWYLIAFLPSLAWSRLVLGRHHPVELGVGVAIGTVAGLLLYLV